MFNSEIIKNVYSYYAENKDECDSKYIKSKEKLTGLYVDINDADTFYKLLAKASIVILTANSNEKKELHIFCKYDIEVNNRKMILLKRDHILLEVRLI